MMDDQNSRIIEETSKRVMEQRKRVIRYNLLMILFFCFVVIGLGGAIYYYDRLKKLNVEIAKSKAEIIKINDSLILVTNKLDTANKKLAVQEERLSKLIDSASKSVNPNKILAPVVSARDSARAYARIGYYKLQEKKLVEAMHAFDKSEKFYNGYRDSYEVYFLLWKNRNNLKDPQIGKQLLERIYKDYNSLGILKQVDIK